MLRRALAALLFTVASVAPVDAQLGPTQWLGFDSAPTGQTGPYVLDLLLGPNGPATGQQLSVVCIDYHNAVHSNSVWNANVSYLGATAGSLSNTRLGMASASNYYARYLSAAYLSSVMTTPALHSQYAAIHKAIWRTTTEQGYAGGGSQTSYWFTQGQQAANTILAGGTVQGFDPGEWAILTDVDAQGATGGVQEYMVRVPVPEPSTVLLLLTGMIGLMLFGARRSQEIRVEA